MALSTEFFPTNPNRARLFGKTVCDLQTEKCWQAITHRSLSANRCSNPEIVHFHSEENTFPCKIPVEINKFQMLRLYIFKMVHNREESDEKSVEIASQKPKSVAKGGWLRSIIHGLSQNRKTSTTCRSLEDY